MNKKILIHTCIIVCLWHNIVLFGQGLNIPLGCSNSGPEINPSPKADLRGTYLTTVYNLDWPSNRSASVATQQTELLNILDKLVDTGINTVYFQVRPECDAFYNSSIEPWSYWLTGIQGTAPNPIWDPLQFAITECRKRGLDLHAWLNPYRASVGGYTLANNHVSKLHPSWIFTASNNSNLKVLNPGLPEVRNYIVSIINDIASRYDIDGIVFDDYFYPDQGMTTNQDASTYANYNPKNITNIDDWRRDNVNQMIANVYDALQVINTNNNKNIVFGVAPFGIWKNGVPTGIIGNSSYSALYCDPINWLQNGKVDYIAPQLYWKIGGSQDYIKLSQWWNDQAAAAGRHLYISQGYDRLPATSQNWEAIEIQNQINQNRISSMGNTFGQTSYSTKFIMRDEKGIATALKNNQYKLKAFPPSMPWKDNVCPTAPTNIRFEGSTLKWDAPLAATDGDLAVKYVIYAFQNQSDANTLKQDASKIIDIVSTTEKVLTQSQLSAPNNYFLVTALDKNNNESNNVIGTTINNIAAAPTPINPTSGQYYVELPVTFNWNSAIADAEYRIQIAKSNANWSATNGFTTATTPDATVVVNGNIGTAQSFIWDQINANVAESPIGGETYYYTVRSYSVATGVSQYSAPISFTTKSPNCSIPTNNEIILDNTDASLVGTWTTSTSTPGYIGSNYIHDGNTSKGTKTATFTPNIIKYGKYDVSVFYTAGTNRATNVTYQINHAQGSTNVVINQQTNNNVWVSLGKYELKYGTSNSVVVKNELSNGYVIVDGVRFKYVDCLPEVPAIADFSLSSNSICQGSNVTFTNSSSNAETYNWTFVGGTPNTSTALNPIVTYATPGTYDVSLTVTNAYGTNTKTSTAAITVLAQPTITLSSAPATSNQTLCSNTTLTPIIYTIGGSATGATVTGLPAGLSSNWNAGTLTISGTPTVVGSYNYTVNTTGGCSTNSLSGSLTINAGTPVTAGFTSPYVEVATGESLTLTNTSTGATSYAWTFPNGSPATSTAANPTVSFTTTGSKTITLVASNSCGSATYTMNICVGTSTKTTLETFETSAGRFTQAPTTSGSTVGIATTSTLARATDSFKTGTASLKAILNDNTASTSNWTVRLLSGGGTPANNQAFTGNQGTFGFWMRTSTANAGATVTAWIDDADGLEELPPIAIINNGAWNYYSWFLPTAVGTTITTGNGIVSGASVTLDAIVIKQNNTANTMTVWIDDIQHTYIANCSGTRKSIEEKKPHEEILATSIQVYPNPSNGAVTISRNTDQATTLSIVNILGQEVKVEVLTTQEHELNLTHLPNGMYFLNFTTEKERITKKMIIQK